MEPRKLISITLIALAITNMVIIIVLQSYGSMLKPYGIIAFEFAGNVEQAQRMVAVWHENNVLNKVFFLLGFDYLFMITYGSFLGLACWRMSLSFGNLGSKIYLGLAMLQPVAAMFDAVENAALYQIATGSLDGSWPALSFYCAIPKFALVSFAIIGLIVGLVMKFMKKY